MKNQLPVAEQFSSIQGEGRFMGHPAVFLRTAGCNFLCGGYQALEEYGDTEFGEKVRAMSENMGEGEAEWVCDTISEWMDGDQYNIEDLYDEWIEEGYLERIDQGNHIVLTGGEPMLHQEQLVNFLDQLEDYGHEPFVEVETNASIYPSKEFRRHVDQYNLSPKLSNSGIQKEVRYREEVIESYVEEFINEQSYTNADFKFVVGSSHDWEEIESEFLSKFGIPRENTFLMPAGADQNNLEITREDVADLAVENSARFSERLQIMIWDEATGV